MQQNITTISKVLAETIMYYRVKIEAAISDNIRQHELHGKMVTVCTGVVQNDAGLVNASIFEELTNKVVNGKSYSFTKLNVGRFKRECAWICLRSLKLRT